MFFNFSIFFLTLLRMFTIIRLIIGRIYYSIWLVFDSPNIINCFSLSHSFICCWNRLEASASTISRIVDFIWHCGPSKVPSVGTISRSRAYRDANRILWIYNPAGGNYTLYSRSSGHITLFMYQTHSIGKHSVRWSESQHNSEYYYTLYGVSFVRGCRSLPQFPT